MLAKTICSATAWAIHVTALWDISSSGSWPKSDACSRLCESAPCLLSPVFWLARWTTHMYQATSILPQYFNSFHLQLHGSHGEWLWGTCHSNSSLYTQQCINRITRGSPCATRQGRGEHFCKHTNTGPAVCRGAPASHRNHTPHYHKMGQPHNACIQQLPCHCLHHMTSNCQRRQQRPMALRLHQHVLDCTPATTAYRPSSLHVLSGSFVASLCGLPRNGPCSCELFSSPSCQH